MSPKNRLVPLPPETQRMLRRLRQLGFLNYAAQYADAAGRVPLRRVFSPVPYMLYCRSIELSLKAYLLSRDVSPKALAERPFRHNLVRILAYSDKLDLSKCVRLTRKHRSHIQRAHVYYDSKGFEYFDALKEVGGRRQLPELDVLAEAASRLVTALTPELAA